MNVPYGEPLPSTMEYMNATPAPLDYHSDIVGELTGLLPYAQNRTNLYEGHFTTEAMPNMSLEVTIVASRGEQNSTSVSMLPVYMGIVSLQGIEAVISEELSENGGDERILVVPNGDHADGGETFYDMLAHAEDTSLPESLRDFADLVLKAIGNDIGETVEEGVLAIEADGFESIFSGLTFAVMDLGEDVEFMTDGTFVDPSGREVKVATQGAMVGDGSCHELGESSLGEDSPIAYVERTGDFRYIVLPYGEGHRVVFIELDADSNEILPEITDEMRATSGVTVVESPDTIQHEGGSTIAYTIQYEDCHQGYFTTREKAQFEADRFYASLLADRAGERTLTITRAMRVRAVLRSLNPNA